MKVIISQNIPESALAMLREAGHQTVVLADEIPLARDELLTSVSGADALITVVSNQVDEALLDAAGPQLKVVANFAVGTNNIDLEVCRKRGVAVSNTPGVLSDATADQAMMLLLATARRAIEGDKLVRQGAWQGWEPLQLLGLDLHGKTLGIVGMGRIGLELARRALAFKLHVVYHNRSRDKEAEAELDVHYVEELHDLLGQSDFISLHTPLTDETHHLIGEAEFKAMKQSAVIVNTARGPVIDEQALLRALQEGWIWGAGLDVFEHEPELTPGLADRPNVVLAPHLGSATHGTREAMARLCAESAIAVLKGLTVPHLLNPEVVAKG